MDLRVSSEEQRSRTGPTAGVTNELGERQNIPGGKKKKLEKKIKTDQ